MKAIRTLLSAVVVATMLVPAVAQAPRRITLPEALQMIDAAVKESASKNYRLSFAVVDARGDLVALVRMPGAGANTPDTAIGKAMAAAFFGQPSASLAAGANTPLRVSLNESTGGRLRYIQGAVPIVRDGVTVGAIGASGANSQQDEDMAKSGMAVLPR